MLECAQTLLVVIDIQDKLMPRQETVAEGLLANSIKLIHTAHTLSIPIVVSEQNPEKLGGTNARVAEALRGAARIPKMEFGCFANPDFVESLEGHRRKQLLVIGMETHICVMQTVLAALEAGYEAYVVRDAVVSMERREYEAGLERMTRAGAVPVTTQMALFELLRAAGTPEFRAMLPLLK